MTQYNYTTMAALARYLCQPFVVERDAYGEAVVEEDQAQGQHCLPHKGNVQGPPPHPWASKNRSLS